MPYVLWKTDVFLKIYTLEQRKSKSGVAFGADLKSTCTFTYVHNNATETKNAPLPYRWPPSSLLTT